MKSRTFSRRAILRGAGATVALPLLDVIPAFAQSPVRNDTMPAGKNRLAYLYFPNGIPRGIWYPEKTGSSGELIKLNEWMSPLEPSKDDIIIPSNVCRR